MPAEATTASRDVSESQMTRSMPRPFCAFYFFFFNDTATTEIYTLSLHDALPILSVPTWRNAMPPLCSSSRVFGAIRSRSEEHTSELQSQSNLVCRLLLEKKKKRPDGLGPPSDALRLRCTVPPGRLSLQLGGVPVL